MTLATALLKAEHVGVRNLRSHLSRSLKKAKPIVITDHGVARKVLIDYQDLLEISDILEEIQDAETMRLVQEGKKSMREGGGIPIADSFARIRARRK